MKDLKLQPIQWLNAVTVLLWYEVIHTEKLYQDELAKEKYARKT